MDVDTGACGLVLTAKPETTVLAPGIALWRNARMLRSGFAQQKWAGLGSLPLSLLTYTAGLNPRRLVLIRCCG